MGSGEVVVLVTGSGSSATPSTVYSLKRNPEGRRVRVVCTDIREGVVARFMCNRFYRVPRASEPGFIDAVLEIAGREGVSVVLPQAPAELPVFAAARERLRREGVVVAVSAPGVVATALDKYRMVRAAERLGVPVPRVFLVRSWEELVGAAEELGYPGEPFVVRVGSGDGMRGFRVVVPPDKAGKWFRGERPGGAPWTTLSGLREILGGGWFEAPVMVAEYLPGEEYTVDVLAGDAGGGYRVYAVVPRRRLEMRISMTWVGVVEERRDVMEYSVRLAEGLGLEYVFGFQFRLDGEGVPRLLECNPRIQSTMIASTFAGANVVWGAVKLALGEEPGPYHVRWGTILYRYWGAIGVYGGGIVASDWALHVERVASP